MDIKSTKHLSIFSSAPVAAQNAQVAFQLQHGMHRFLSTRYTHRIPANADHGFNDQRPYKQVTIELLVCTVTAAYDYVTPLVPLTRVPPFADDVLVDWTPGRKKVQKFSEPLFYQGGM
jgi:hypothetical protein